MASSQCPAPSRAIMFSTTPKSRQSLQPLQTNDSPLGYEVLAATNSVTLILTFGLLGTVSHQPEVGAAQHVLVPQHRVIINITPTIKELVLGGQHTTIRANKVCQTQCSVVSCPVVSCSVVDARRHTHTLRIAAVECDLQRALQLHAVQV